MLFNAESHGWTPSKQAYRCLQLKSFTGAHAVNNQSLATAPFPSPVDIALGHSVAGSAVVPSSRAIHSQQSRSSEFRRNSLRGRGVPRHLYMDLLTTVISLKGRQPAGACPHGKQLQCGHAIHAIAAPQKRKIPVIQQQSFQSRYIPLLNGYSRRLY